MSIKYFSKILNNLKLFWRKYDWCMINFKEENILCLNNFSPLLGAVSEPLVQLGNLTWYLASNLLFQREWAISWIERRRLWVLPLKWRAFGSSRSCPPICLSSCRTSYDMPKAKSGLLNCITSAGCLIKRVCFVTRPPDTTPNLCNMWLPLLQPQDPSTETPGRMWLETYCSPTMS